jgi:hypothetical protein
VRPPPQSAQLAILLAALLAAALAAGVTHATETQLWVTDSPADYARAESRGVVVGPDGVLALGPRAASSPADSLTVIWAMAVLADGSVALGGDGGRVDRWTESGGVRPWARLLVGQVLALAADGDGVVAGTGPNGLIYRIGARGDTTLAARTGERYVWGLAPAAAGAWYAATGTRGRLLEVKGSRSRILLDSDESNLVSLAADGRGGAYAGGDSKGRILHLRANGSTSTVYDAAEDEVRALALGRDGALYAGAASASATALSSGGGGTAGSGGSAGSGGGAGATPSEEERDEEQPVRSAVSGGRATVYRIVPDSVAVTLWTSSQPFVFALAGPPGTSDAAGRILAGTGNRAGVYLVGPPGHGAQWLAAPQGQVTALATDARGRVFAATSNPGALWRLGPERAERGELLSQVLDARRYARFGRIRWRGEARGGRVELLTRTGNTDPPDTTWSPWASAGDEGRSRVTSPAARYLQWKLVLAGGDARVDAVEVAWREQNLAPRIDDLAVAPQGVGFREGDLQPRSEPVTQTLPGGQKVEYSISTSSQKALRELPAWARGLRTVSWKASDPNGDPLRYQVDVRSENGSTWTSLGENLEATSFTWDTHALPDGRYRLRLKVTDRPGNAVGEELTAEALSEPFNIDNTAPAVTELDVRGEAGSAVVSGRAEDGHSMLTRLEVAVDEGDWRTVTPEGGLADERVLSFRARLEDLKPGEHTVGVRAVDLAGNSATRAVRVTVPPGR